MKKLNGLISNLVINQPWKDPTQKKKEPSVALLVTVLPTHVEVNTFYIFYPVSDTSIPRRTPCWCLFGAKKVRRQIFPHTRCSQCGQSSDGGTRAPGLTDCGPLVNEPPRRKCVPLLGTVFRSGAWAVWPLFMPTCTNTIFLSDKYPILHEG